MNKIITAMPSISDVHGGAVGGGRGGGVGGPPGSLGTPRGTGSSHAAKEQVIGARARAHALAVQ